MNSFFFFELSESDGMNNNEVGIFGVCVFKIMSNLI